MCNVNQHGVDHLLHNLCKFRMMHVRQKLLEEALTLQRALSFSETDFATELGVSLATWSNWKARNAISKDGLEKILENRPDLVLSLAGKEIHGTNVADVADAAASLVRLANAQDDFSDEQAESPEITKLIKAARNAPKSAVKAATELLTAAANGKPEIPKASDEDSRLAAFIKNQANAGLPTKTLLKKLEQQVLGRGDDGSQHNKEEKAQGD